MAINRLDITRILEAMERGDPAAPAELLAQVYQELRQLAARKMAGEAPGHTLQATALGMKHGFGWAATISNAFRTVRIFLLRRRSDAPNPGGKRAPQEAVEARRKPAANRYG